MSRYTAPGPRGAAAARVIAGFVNGPLGSYRATLTAADIAGNRSAPSRVTFRVVRR